MSGGPLADALEKEHRDIDGGIEAYVESVKVGDPTVEPLMKALAAQRRHIYLEEEVLFPGLKGKPGMMMAIMVMVKQHGEIWNRMDALEQQVQENADHDGAAAACGEILELLERHNSKEEPVIYAKTDEFLDAEVAAKLADFLASSTLPESWRAQAA